MAFELWLAESFAAMLAGAGYILFSRRATKIGIPVWAILTWAMLATAIVSAALAGKFGHRLVLPSDPGMMAVLALAIVCCGAGNAFELLAVARAPNAAYVSAINKSYAAVTLFAAWWMFGSELALPKIIGVLAVVGSLVLVWAPWQAGKISGKSDFFWIACAFVSFFGLGGLSLCGKYLMQGGMDRLVFLVLLTAPVSALFAIGWIVSSDKMPRSRQAAVLMAGIGLTSALANYFLYSAILIAPNLGYVNAINSAQIVAVAVISALAFGDKLTFWRTLGIVGVTLGLLRIAI